MQKQNSVIQRTEEHEKAWYIHLHSDSAEDKHLGLLQLLQQVEGIS